MALAEESDLEKTEPASPRRLEQAREEGNVPHSRELMAFMVMAAGAGTFWVLGSWIVQGIADLLRHGLSFNRVAAFDTAIMRGNSLSLTVDAFMYVGPLFLVIIAAIIATPFVMGGWVFSPKAFKLDFTRIDLSRGLGACFPGKVLRS